MLKTERAAINKSFHYTSCGLKNVWLRNGFDERDTSYGKGIAIQDVEGLHRAIGLYLVQNKPRLSGAEIRFLRKELDMPQSQLGMLLGVSENTLRGWENNRTRITKPAERMLRVLYYEYARGASLVIRDLILQISQLNREIHIKKMEFEKTEETWSAAA
jgi:putative transcriptional regulator